MTLKGGRLTASFEYYARIFLSRKSHLPPSQKVVLVPCPDSPERAHALSFCQALANILGVDYVVALERQRFSGPQKDKASVDRQRISFQRTQNLEEKHVIFIDDIVTSGATVTAARKALGPVAGFEVWCLARRRLLVPDQQV